MDQQQLMADWGRAAAALKERSAVPAPADTTTGGTEDPLLIARLDGPTAEKKKKCNSLLSYV